MQHRTIGTAAIVLSALASAPFAFLAVVPAAAADLPGHAAPAIEEEGEAPPPMPVFSWGGAYAGAQAGYAWGRDRVALGAPGLPRLGQGTDVRGIVGGAHLGYALTTTPSLERPVGVFGIEADVEGADLRRRPFGGALSPAVSGLREDLQGSVRARAGVGVRRVLYYGTGGLAVAAIRTDVPGAATPRADHTRLGYTLGGGVAYAMTNHVALRAEYRYTEFGRTTDRPGLAGVDGAVITHRDSVQRLQGGISYMFADPVPVSRVD